jgi:hypothetical protein
MAMIEIKDYSHPVGWAPGVDSIARAREACRSLEEGGILFFKSPPFSFPQQDREFLLGAQQSALLVHKNISYRPTTDVLRGLSDADESRKDRLREIMAGYSKQATAFLDRFLAPYASSKQLDYASFRPIEEEARPNSLHKRNDLLHVDAFPTRPTYGGRILRIFTNINPQQERRWRTTVPFPELVETIGAEADLKGHAKRLTSAMRSGSRSVVRGIKKVLPLPVADRSAYDSMMLGLHDKMKENSRFQETCPKFDYSFAPGTSWMCYTDGVSHAVLSGRFAIEQTYIIPVEGLVAPEASPIRVLEKWCGRELGR